MGPRFPDMCAPYDPELIGIAQAAGKELGIPCHKGVFVAVPGPNLETRADSKETELQRHRPLHSQSLFREAVAVKRNSQFRG